MIECSIENFVLVVAVAKHKAAPSVDFRPPKETLSEKKKWRTPRWICWSHLRKDHKNLMHLSQLQTLEVTPGMLIEEKPLEDKPLSVVTDAGGRIPWQKESKRQNNTSQLE